jgi:hypothetical protein
METGGLSGISGMEDEELRSHGITESRREGIRMSGMWIYGITEVDFGWNFGAAEVAERYYNDITTVLQ